jgi:hypothetical protein
MLLRSIAVLVLLAVSATGTAAPRKQLVIQKKAADPLEAWFDAEDRVANGDPAGALARLRAALEVIGKLAATARVGGPAGASWTQREALFRYTMRAADVASLVSWREAATLLESAVKAAPDKDSKQQAQLQLEAARAQLEAGHDRAPSFLGDDPARLVDDPGTAPLQLDVK